MTDRLYGNYRAEVVDNKDSEMFGRVKVWIPDLMPEIEPQKGLWARPANNYSASSATGGGYHSVPKLGSIVNVNFDNGNIYSPEYTFTQKISDE